MKKISIIFVILLFLISVVIFEKQDNIYRVTEVISPVELRLNNEIYKISGLDVFDCTFTKHNKELAKSLNISENEAFAIGNLAKYWAKNLMLGRTVQVGNNDIIYLKYSYRDKFLYSGFCIKNSKLYNKSEFDKKLKDIRNSKYKVLDLDNDKIYDTSDSEIRNLKNFLVIKKRHLPGYLLKKKVKSSILPAAQIFSDKEFIIDSGDVQIYFSDLTTKIKPTNKCDSSICKVILNNINSAENSIDMAIYGYSKIPEIEKALVLAMQRGVKIRLVYDSDLNGKNIYPDTPVLTGILKDNKSDFKSNEVNNIMHNKFYVFDNKTVITGSANLSNTDMSGFNSNSIVLIKSNEAARIYKQEFEQMYAGKFHNSKNKIEKSEIKFGNTNLKIYFSPCDSGITNAVIPIINRSNKYIYIPIFVLTEKRVCEALINAQKRGVDVKIIVDALNASVKHSKHNLLRQNGIPVKTENYAGKMHSKSLIADDKYTIIGSMNFSYSGEKKNDENFVVIENEEIAKAYKKFFLYQWNKIDNKWLKYNAGAESVDSIGSCSDGIDNDYDGLIDMKDTGCQLHNKI